MLLPAGFGLGALNDADEDDIDIYDSGSSSRRNRTAYETGDESRHHPSIRQKNVTGSQMNVPRVSPPRNNPDHCAHSPRPPTQSRTAPLQRFGNGEPVLVEFMLADTSVTDDKWHVLTFDTWLGD